jgi:hypothetical protein
VAIRPPGIGKPKMEYRERLVKAIAKALGYYMAARVSGREATAQLQRYKRLGKRLEEYDKEQ